MSGVWRRSGAAAGVFVLAAVGGVLGNQLSRTPGGGFAWDGFAIGFVVVTVVGAVGAVLLDRWDTNDAEAQPAAASRGPLIGTAKAKQINVAETMTIDQRRQNRPRSRGTSSNSTGDDSE